MRRKDYGLQKIANEKYDKFLHYPVEVLGDRKSQKKFLFWLFVFLGIKMYNRNILDY